MVGKSLSHYNITAELGRGGMGIVYKAEDTKLDRTVAIKVLPPSALANEDDRARFYREAKAAAQLHHPHIASIFEIDEAVPEGGSSEEPRPFIAMEYIEGEQLDVRIKAGLFALEDAVRVASQMASALEAAHEKNIVHRDIKSANVMFTKKGDAKVLDFGLAQTAQSTKLTQMGSTLGTIAYMSPEQARGEAVDQRTDLWSLGVVLYEMIAGRMPFAADYEQAAIYGILNEDPEPLTAIRTGVPMGLEWIATKLLAKKAADRYQNASDLLVDLRTVDLSSTGFSTSSAQLNTSLAHVAAIEPVKNRMSVLTALPWIFFGAALVALVWFFAPSKTTETGTVSPKRMTIPLTVDGTIITADISPDGDLIAIGGVNITVFDLKSGEKKIFQPSSSAIFLDFSDDGKSLLLASGIGISRMSVETGTEIPILTTKEGGPRASWIDSDNIIHEETQGIFTTSLTSGQSSPVVMPDSSIGNYDLDFPVMIPGRRIVMATAEFRNNAPSKIGFWNLDTGENLAFIDTPGYRPQPLQNSHIVFELDGEIMAIPFDFDSFTRTGPMSLVMKNGRPNGFSVARDGTFILVKTQLGSGVTGRVTPLIVERVAASANVKEMKGFPADRYRSAAISPDGSKAAVVVETTDGTDLSTDIWILDFDKETRRPLSRGGMSDFPVWTPDGDSIRFVRRNRSDEIWQRAANGTGEERLYIETFTLMLADLAISRDGRTMAAVMTTTALLNSQSSLKVWLPDGPVRLFKDKDNLGNIRHPTFSPDGRFLAVDDRGKILVLTLDDIDATPYVAWETSMSTPKWSPDGKRLYAIPLDGLLHSVPIQTDPVFSVIGAPRMEINWILDSTSLFDVFPDGQFLVPNPVSSEIVSDDFQSTVEVHDLRMIINLSGMLEE